MKGKDFHSEVDLIIIGNSGERIILKLTKLTS